MPFLNQKEIPIWYFPLLSCVALLPPRKFGGGLNLQLARVLKVGHSNLAVTFSRVKNEAEDFSVDNRLEITVA